jgi:phage major head subunit gpT-like protein
MPVYTPKQLNDLTRQIETDFEIAFEDANKLLNWVNQLSFQVSTNKLTINQKWIYDYAKLTERNLAEPPQYKDLAGEYATYELKEYGDALRISAYDISEDDEGLLLSRASDLGKEVGRFESRLAADILNNGDSDYIIYDGQPIFSNTHSKPNGGNIDNLISGTLDTTAYQAARVAMMRFVSDLNDTDDVYGIAPTHLIVPPELEVTANQIVNNGLLPVENFNTENAVLRGSAKVLTEARLTDTNDWFVATDEFGVNPFMIVKHRDYGDFKIHAEIDDDSQAFRDHRERRWWTFALRLVYPTRPETMIKVVNA